MELGWVYVAKMMFGIYSLAQQGVFSPGQPHYSHDYGRTGSVLTASEIAYALRWYWRIARDDVLASTQVSSHSRWPQCSPPARLRTTR
jgi:hypothetical protein